MHRGDRRGRDARALRGRARIQHLLRGAKALASHGESHVADAGIRIGARAGDVALSLEAVDGDGHGGDGHAHVRGQLGYRGGVHAIEVAEYARLSRADFRPRVRVEDVSRVAGEVDPGIQVDEVVAGANGHVELE